VLAISRANKTSDKKNITYVALDIFNVNELAHVLKDFDVVVSAYNSGWSNPDIYNEFLKGSQAIQQAVKTAGSKRYIVIGGAGSLYVADGIQMVDTEGFPAEFLSGALAARDYLKILKEEKNLDWAFFSPAIEMHPGINTGRTGKYRLGTEHPVTDAAGKSILSVQDLAVVIADEIETPKHHQMRFTAAY
jgi:putative NADH-flavin reductase